MNEFEETKAELMRESLEDLLEQVFSGSYVPGPTEAAIREKVAELRRSGVPKGCGVWECLKC